MPCGRGSRPEAGKNDIATNAPRQSVCRSFEPGPRMDKVVLDSRWFELEVGGEGWMLDILLCALALGQATPTQTPQFVWIDDVVRSRGVVRLTGLGVGWLAAGCWAGAFSRDKHRKSQRKSRWYFGISTALAVLSGLSVWSRSVSKVQLRSTSEREAKTRAQPSARRNFRTIPLAALSSTRHTNKAFRQQHPLKRSGLQL
jgi:hypothetical protein